MAKRINAKQPDRLLGKKLVFSGKFDKSERFHLVWQAEAQQGTVLEELDGSANYLILADPQGSKAVQKQVASLNAKGAAVQVLDIAAYQTMVDPTLEDVLSVMRSGKDAAQRLSKLFGWLEHYYGRRASHPPTRFTIDGEDFENVDLSLMDLKYFVFTNCSFVQSKLKCSAMGKCIGCDFTKAKGELGKFGDLISCNFTGVKLTQTRFEGNIVGCNFNSADITDVSFHSYSARPPIADPPADVVCTFRGAKMANVSFDALHLTTPDFSEADLTDSSFTGCRFDKGNFRGAVLQRAMLSGSKFPGADFRDADLSGANLANADLTGVDFTGANLASCNLQDATLDKAELSKATNYVAAVAKSTSAGPALKALDALAQQAGRLYVTFSMRPSSKYATFGVDSDELKRGRGILLGGQNYPEVPGRSFSDAMLLLAKQTAHQKILYETVKIESSKSPVSNKALRDAVLAGIAEAFGQPLPDPAKLAAATKSHRDEKAKAKADRAAKAAEYKKEADENRKKVAAMRAAAQKQLTRKIEKAVGKVSDIATFLKALELRVDEQKIEKATKMLKASGFQLFNDVADTHLNGVVKSQTDPDLVYACRIESDGKYACCTQNLNICGGLRGSICKHLLVLIIGLVQAGELDPTTIDAWIAKSHNVKAELNKETMGEIFIRYKGAEAGEVDWRPTQTVPEDYYTL